MVISLSLGKSRQGKSVAAGTLYTTQVKYAYAGTMWKGRHSHGRLCQKGRKGKSPAYKNGMPTPSYYTAYIRIRGTRRA